MFCTTFMSLFSLLFSLAVLGSLFRQGKAAEYYVFWLTIQRFIESNCMCTQQYCSLSLPMPPTFYISLISRENCLLLARLSKRHRERKWIQYSKLVTNVTNYSATHQLICYNPSTVAWPIIWMALSIGNKKNSINIYWKRIKVEGAHYKKAARQYGFSRVPGTLGLYWSALMRSPHCMWHHR